MQDLNITLVQSKLHWEDHTSNIRMFDEIVQTETSTDLVVLPEMFSTGFTMEPEPVAENFSESPSIDWMKKASKENDVSITGSIAINEGGRYYNRMVFAKPDGGLYFYDKRHLFRMAGEHKHYSAGDSLTTVKLKGWRIALFVCYDLRFPVWSRNKNDYDCAIYVANWPKVRRDPWSALLKARAIENQCYIVGVNRVGKDGNGISYSGDSAVYDPKGNLISDIAPDKPSVTNVSLDMSDLEAFREKFPVFMDADRFKIL